MKLIAKDIQLATGRGVTVCAFIQEPPNWGADIANLRPEEAYDLSEVGLLLNMLRSFRVHVNPRKKIHAKLAVIDDRILWEGSLNILSHANTKEHMRRVVAESEVRAAIEKYALFRCSECAANRSQYASGTESRWALDRFGEMVAAERVRLRLSQRALAEKCGMPHTTISKIEAGANATLSTVFRISQQLEVEFLPIPRLFVPSISNVLRQMIATQRITGSGT